MNDEIISKISNEFTHLNIFLIGDFNYVIDVDTEVINLMNSGFGNSKLLHDHDQLNEVKRDIFDNMLKEGVNNAGPLFDPTWSLKKIRGKDCQVGDTLSDGSIQSLKPKCFSSRKDLGWRSRILFGSAEDSTYVSNCIFYNSFDVGKIRDSPDSALVGIYDIYYPVQ